MTSGLTAQTALAVWLAWQETAHTRSIDLGLARVARVNARMAGPLSKPILTVTIAGTNGKGSSAAMLESIFNAAGYRTGVYSTPHVLRYNERIRIDQQAVTDSEICRVFAAIDEARADISLSYFEFGTLAAIRLFEQTGVDVQILEVGLGGRLDAVNIIDADVSLITTIDLDHAEWLGTDRSVIATEKAGIFRAGQLAVCADPTVPMSLIEYARTVKTDLICAGRDYHASRVGELLWEMVSASSSHERYPGPALPGCHQIQNAAGVVQVIQGINERFAGQFSIPKSAIDQGLQQASVPGRMQRVGSEPAIWLDVAHNPQSARALADFFAQQLIKGRHLAVLAVMADKDVAGIVEPLLAMVDRWYITTLDLPRAAPTGLIKDIILQRQPQAEVYEYANVEMAWQSMQQEVSANDGVIAFGSFYLVEACLRAL